MFFEKEEDLLNIISRVNFSIISGDSKKLKKLLEKKFKKSVFFLEPEEKTGKISVENVRNFTSMTDSKESSDKFFIILNSETMNESAENAILKNVEEPKENHHFIFITKTPSVHLPTILSRAQVFYKKEKKDIKAPIDSDDKIKAYAKQLISSDQKGLITLANELSKKKDNARSYSEKVVEVAIEMLYKSYFLTKQEKFLKKLPNLIKLHENLSKNGHIKLHLVADML